MSVRKGKTKTDYARHDEETELERFREAIWRSKQTIEFWFYPDTYGAYTSDLDGKEFRSKEGQENRNMERAYTSVCKTHHASYSGGYCGQRNTRKSCTNHRVRR